MNDNRPIGIFDSGLGGLTVVAELKRLLPNENVVYLGDNARVPYGCKSKETIVKFAMQDAKFLVEQQVKCIVIACNTVSALALTQLQREYPEMPFVGVVEAGVKSVLELNARRVLLIGTTATVNSDSYRMQINRQAPRVEVRSLACPLFVPLVEEGIVDEELTDMVVKRYLESEFKSSFDALVLGCTHYPLLKRAIEKIMPKNMAIVDSATSCAKAVERHLKNDGFLAKRSERGEERFFVTDVPASFFAMAKRFLGRTPKSVDKVLLT